MAGPIRISILANASQAKRELNDTGSTASKLGSKLSSFGKVAALGLAAAGAGAVLMGRSVIKASSDAQQSIGATQSVFGKYADTVIKTSDKAATKYGLSAHSYRENANLIGSLLKNQGVAMKDLGSETENLVKHGADLAATFGGTTKNAVDALGGALKGEFERMEAYGVSIKAADVSTLLAARGQDKLSGSAEKAARRQAVLDLVMKQSKSSVGAFGRESNTLANQQQVLAAKFDNIKVKLGNFLLPLITRLAIFVSDKVLPALAKWGNALQGPLSQAFDAIKSAIDRFRPTIEKIVGFLKANPAVVKTFAIVLGVLTAAVVVASVAVGAFNAVLYANPIGLVVIAIAALAAALVYAYKKSETFRNIVNKTWTFIRAATAKVFPVIKRIVIVTLRVIGTYLRTMFAVYKAVFRAGWAVIKTVTRVAWVLIKNFVIKPVRAIVAFIRNPLATIKTLFRNAWQNVKDKTRDLLGGMVTAVRNKIGDAMALIRGIKGKVTGAFAGAAGWLVAAGRSIITGLLNGFKEAWGAASGWLSDRASEIRKLKGPPAKDKKLLVDNGRLIMRGLRVGLEKGMIDVRKTLTSATNEISGFDATLGAHISPSVALSGSLMTSNSSTVTVTLTAEQISQLQRGREIQADLDVYRKSGGRVRA